MCTGRIAFVFGVIAASAAAGSRFSVTGSISANTGVAPQYRIALAEATNENGLVITSSSGSTPAARLGAKGSVPGQGEPLGPLVI